MISDVLCDAIEGIEEWEKDNAYDTPVIQNEIADVKARISSLMRKLANPLGFFDIQDKASYLECCQCGEKSFQIDLADESRGYCHAEKKVWVISPGELA